MKPPRIHAAKTSVAEPTARAMSLATRKMPVPIVSPITIAAAAHNPRPRIRSDRSGWPARLGLVTDTKVEERLLSAMETVNPHCDRICLCRGTGTYLRAIIKTAMATQKFMLSEFAWDQRYRVAAVEDVLTPALVLYPEIVSSNIQRTLELLDGNADRWRVHIKTAKLGYTLRMLLERGVGSFKCATTLELLVACRSGAGDVLFAYPAVGANVRRVREIAEQFPEVRISVLAENEEQVRQWRRSRVGVFLDINPGMDRTGIEQSQSGEVVALARAIGADGLEFRGLHYYDGQYGELEEPERTQAAHDGYHDLLKVVREVERGGMGVPEVITA